MTISVRIGFLILVQLTTVDEYDLATSQYYGTGSIANGTMTSYELSGYSTESFFENL